MKDAVLALACALVVTLLWGLVLLTLEPRPSEVLPALALILAVRAF